MLSQKIKSTIAVLDMWAEAGQSIPPHVQKGLIMIMESWLTMARGMECGVVPVQAAAPHAASHQNVIPFDTARRAAAPTAVDLPDGAA